MNHVSGFNMLVDMVELLIFGGGVGFVFFLLYKFFAPFKNLVEKFVKADEY